MNIPGASITLDTSKDRAVFETLERILGMEGESPRLSGMFFKSVVQAFMIFGLETKAGPLGGSSTGSQNLSRGVRHSIKLMVFGTTLCWRL